MGSSISLYRHHKTKRPVLSDPQLCTNIKAGDKSAEAELYARYYPRAVFVLRQRARSYGEMDVEDLAQETMIVVIRRLRGKGIEDPDRLAGFIQRTAQNLYIGKARLDASRQTVSVPEIPDHAVDGIADSFGTVLQRETEQLVQRLLQELTVQRDRDILQQHYLMGLEKAVVCENLGLTANQFDKVIYKARGRLRSLVEQRETSLSG